MRPLAILPALLVIAACLPSLSVPEQSLIVCERDADCPAPRISSESLSRCIDPGGDETAPVVETILLRVLPCHGTGSSAVPAALQIDYLEATVTYRL